MNIQLDDEGSNGKAFLRDQGTIRAAMTFSKAGSKLIIINHTEVDDDLRGQNVGRLMLDRIVEYARKEKLKIYPLCPFAKSIFRVDESIADVLHKPVHS